MSNKNNDNSQKVIIFIGPHKTGSSTQQWFILNQHKTKNIHPFKWPTNPCNVKEDHKQFSLLSWDIYNNVIDEQQRHQTIKNNANNNNISSSSSSINDKEENDENDARYQIHFKACKWRNHKLKKESKSSIRYYYKKHFQNLWDNGNSIIIAAEILGTMALHSLSHDILKGLLDLMPIETTKGGYNETQRKISNDKITIVANYRTNRLEHLTSVWAQSNKENGYYYEGAAIIRPFLQWIQNMDCTLPEPKLNLNTVDTLGQALSFAQNFKEINVKIIDMEGAEDDGIDIIQSIMCDVFNAFLEKKSDLCYLEKTALSSAAAQRKILSNARIDSAGISSTQQILLSNLLHDLDCSSHHNISMNKNIMVLHQSSSMFQNCSSSGHHDHEGTNATSLRYRRHQYLLSHHGMRYACGLMKNIMNDTTNKSSLKESNNDEILTVFHYHHVIIKFISMNLLIAWIVIAWKRKRTKVN